MKKMGTKIYISGPMSGYDDYNKRAFAEAHRYLVKSGIAQDIQIINPHDLHVTTDGVREDYMRIDLQALIDHCCAIYMLKGWEKSFGAICEYIVAKELGYAVYFEGEWKDDPVTYPPELGDPVSNSSVCLDAYGIVHGARQEAYNHPLDNFTQISEMLNALWKDKLAKPLDAHDIAPMMIVTKLSRHSHAYKRDNLVDIAGYAETDSLVTIEKERRGV